MKNEEFDYCDKTVETMHASSLPGMCFAGYI